MRIPQANGWPDGATMLSAPGSCDISRWINGQVPVFVDLFMGQETRKRRDMVVSNAIPGRCGCKLAWPSTYPFTGKPRIVCWLVVDDALTWTIDRPRIVRCCPTARTHCLQSLALMSTNCAAWRQMKPLLRTWARYYLLFNSITWRGCLNTWMSTMRPRLKIVTEH